MRANFPTVLSSSLIIGGLLAANATGAVMINMPPPKKSAAPVIAPSPAGPAAPAAAVDVGDLALARYAYARTGTTDNYISGVRPYPYSYSYPFGFSNSWWGGPFFFGFVGPSHCKPCPTPCR